MVINKQDTNGVKPLLGKGELGYDDYIAGGDAGRVYVGTGSVNIPQAKKAEVVAVDGKVDTHVAGVNNPHNVTKAQVGLSNVDNTADSTKSVSYANSAGYATTASSALSFPYQIGSLDSETATKVIREEVPSSGYAYTSTLNMSSSDGRQQITVERGGLGMKFRGNTTGSGSTGWSAWRDVIHDANLHTYLASPALTGIPTAPTASVGTNTTQLATTAFVAEAVIGAVPVSTIIAIANGVVPTGFLECNGATISRSTYSALFSKISTLYGAGDGNTNFAIPDLRGEFIRGFDNGRGIDSGRTLGTQQGYDWKGFYMMNTGQNTYNYSHSETYHGKSTTNYNGNTFVGYWAAPSAALGTKWDTSEIRPRNIAMMYCIKY
jgi:microcystin-dependent protein